MYPELFDFRVPCPQTKILIFQGSLKASINIEKHPKFQRWKQVRVDLDLLKILKSYSGFIEN